MCLLVIGCFYVYGEVAFVQNRKLSICYSYIRILGNDQMHTCLDNKTVELFF